MRVIHDLDTEGSASPAGPVHRLDGVAEFLRAQERWLVRGLDRMDDPACTGIVLARLDDSHPAWIGVIGLLHACDPATAQLACELYGLHGRIAGTLEHGFGPLLPAQVRQQLRCLLAAHLRARTEAVTDAVAGIRAHPSVRAD